MTADQQALKDLVDEATNGGRKALTKDQAETVLDMAKETNYPGVRAKAGDVASPSNWDANPVPHIHLPGAEQAEADTFRLSPELRRDNIWKIRVKGDRHLFFGKKT